MLLPFKAPDIVFGVLGRFSHGECANLHSISRFYPAKTILLIHSGQKFLTIQPSAGAVLHIEAEVHDIAVLHAVFFALHTHLTRFFDSRL